MKTALKPVISPPSAPLVSIRSLAKRFDNRPVLQDISLEIAPGEFLTVLGESGSGKTTLLRLIAGFERPDAGEILMQGEPLDPLPPHRRRVNTVFQQYALFPHLSVFDNVAYGLRVDRTEKMPATEIARRAEEALALVKMSEFARRAPGQLSGGQQQRVALARALVKRPRLLLLDEPLSALDASLRREMQSELKSLQREVGIAFLFVTHDQEEAMVLSDRIALLRAGSLEQVANPREIYAHPATVYTAQFIGQTNLFEAAIAAGFATCDGFTWPYRESPSDGSVVGATRASHNGRATFSLRPECIRLVTGSTLPPADGAVRFSAVIRRRVFRGATELLELECASGRLLLARVPSQGDLSGEKEFEFSASDAVRVMPRDS